MSNGILYDIFLSISLLLCVICIIGVFLFTHKRTNEKYQSMISIGELYIAVDVVDTEELRRKGLGGRHMLCDRCGMLFLFDEAKMQSFWMKDMFFDIDIIWIHDDHIVGIERAVPHENKERVVVTSPSQVNRVLEVPSGTVERYAIYSGQNVKYVNKIFEK